MVVVVVQRRCQRAESEKGADFSHTRCMLSSPQSFHPPLAETNNCTDTETQCFVDRTSPHIVHCRMRLQRLCCVRVHWPTFLRWLPSSPGLCWRLAGSLSSNRHAAHHPRSHIGDERESSMRAACGRRVILGTPCNLHPHLGVQGSAWGGGVSMVCGQRRADERSFLLAQPTSP